MDPRIGLMVDIMSDPSIGRRLMVRIIIMACFIAFFATQPSCTDSGEDYKLPTPAIYID